MINFYAVEEEIVKQFVEPILQKINSEVKLVNWDEQKIREKFGKQSLKQILEEKELFYMQPCLPLTIILEHEFEKQGFRPEFVIEELYNPNYKDHGLHFALNFEFLYGLYSINFKKMREVEIIKGPYFNTRKDIESIQLIEFKENLDPNKNIFENSNGLMKKLKHFEFDKQIERMILHNKNPETYNNYLKTLNGQEEFKIYMNLERKKD